MILSTKRVFGVFCFQEQKTVLENIKQTGPKVFKKSKEKKKLHSQIFNSLKEILRNTK